MTANADLHLYDTNLYRVNFDGREFKPLIEASGQHRISFAPSKAYFVDLHSGGSWRTTAELRNADGKQSQTLMMANVEALKELPGHPPEEFVVKADEGKTDFYGVIYKPYDFDPNRKYAVIDYIYSSPWISVVPHSFFGRTGRGDEAHALAQLGYIVFIISKPCNDSLPPIWPRSLPVAEGYGRRRAKSSETVLNS